jgi:MFS family permease
VRTVDFLGSLKMETPWIDQIFGVGGGPMTIGQIAEIAVLAVIPFVAKKWSKKLMLGIGLAAYVLRFAVFAYLPEPAFVFPALALHGLCFGFFFFLCFMIIDEVTSPDVRASAQSLFNFIIVGVGVIVGNYAAGKIGEIAKTADGADNYTTLFAIPMWITVACLVALIAFYPGKEDTPGAQAVDLAKGV